jgi:ribonuclease HI
MPKLTIYTDGACLGNPGPGGWGVVIQNEAGSVELSGNHHDTTNNRMEVLAVIKALEAVPGDSYDLTIYSDSQYMIKGITEWIKGWKKRQWKTADNKPVKNYDLWLTLDGLASLHKITWKWVKGHNGNPGNERADQLASAAAKRAA